MEKKLEGKVAVVTGGSEGIGFGIARDLALNGAYVHLIARTQDKLEAAARQIIDLGGVAEFSQADITELDSIKEIVERIYSEKGRLDIFVNNAGAWRYQTIGEDPDRLRRIRELTDRAPSEITEFLVARFAGAKDEIKILNVASQASLMYLPGNLGYGKGKKGLAITMLELQGELDGGGITNVRLYGLYPATVATPNVMEAIREGKLQNATSLDSVVATASALLQDETPTRHAYVGYLPGKGIVRKYFDLNPATFLMFPRVGEEVVDADFNPESLVN